jgi:hypothetical protein
MRSFSKVALACALVFALAGSAWAAPRAVDSHRKHPIRATGLASVAVVSDDDIPGVAAPVSPISGTLDAVTDPEDVYRLHLTAGQKIKLSMTGAAGTDFDVFLYGPTAVSVSVDDAVAYSNQWYVVPVSGDYYIDAYAFDGSGSYQVTYSTAAAEPDDDIPGVAAPASPISGTLDAATDSDDVYRLHLTAGQKIKLSMTAAAGTEFDVFLYEPSATSVATGEWVAYSDLWYVVPVSGDYYIGATAYDGSGSYEVTYSLGLAEPDDYIPGVAAPASPITGTLDEATDVNDIFKLWLTAGQTFSVSMTGDASTDFDAYLFAPGAASITDESVAEAWDSAYPDTFTYLVPTSGYYYLDARASLGSGAYSVSYSSKVADRPVYRFFNKKNGSHFYTASEAEKNSVLANLSATYALDGPAYHVSPAFSTPLYRFYNKKNGSHFYTASEAEKNSVVAKLSATYALDGPAYNVSATPAAGTVPVYRFFNKKNSSHFYTASEAEKNSVLAKLSATYALDGPAFNVVP